MRAPHDPTFLLRRTLLLGAALLSAPAAGDVVHRTIALSGTPAGPGLVYDTFDHPTINHSGKVLFWARIAATTPASDECAGAIDIRAGGTFISTVGATDSTAPGCGLHSDAWFRYTSPGAESVRFGTTAMNFVPTLAVYRGDCNALVQEVCGAADTAPIALAAGEPVLLRLGYVTAPPAVSTGTCIVTVRPGPASPPPPPVTLSATDAALFSDRGAAGTFEMILREGAPTGFDPLLVHAALPLPAFNDAGTVGVTGGVLSWPPTPQPLSATFTNDSSGATVLIETEVLAPPPDLPDWFLPPPKLSASGEVAYARLDGAGLRYGAEAIASGTPAPGTPEGVNFLFFDQPVVAGGGLGAVAFRSSLDAESGVDDTNNSGLWSDFDGPGTLPPELIARTGSPAPGTPDGVVFARLAVEPGITPEGRLVFWASLTGPGIDTTNSSGIWTDRARTAGLLARAGNPAPLSMEGTVFQSFSKRPVINAARTVAALAYVSGPNVTAETNSGIWIYPLQGSAYGVAHEGAPATGLPEGIAFASFSDPVLNERGDIAFVARVRGRGVTPENNTALFLAGAGGVMTAIVRTGDAFAVSPTETRTVRDIDFGTLPPSSGRGQLNDSGTVVFRLSFTDGSSGLFAADRTCEADVNGDGAVNSQDFFDFLSLFFAGDSRADFNHSGAVTSQDFFDYLAAFFAGC